MSTEDVIFRWLRLNDWKEFKNLQNISCDDKECGFTPYTDKIVNKLFNPFTKDEYKTQFESNFPENKDALKIIAATVKGKVIATGLLWIEKKTEVATADHKVCIIGHILQVKVDPSYLNVNTMLARIIHTLEGLAWINGCTDTMISHGNFPETIITQLKYCFISRNGNSYYFKSRYNNAFLM